MRPPVPTCLPAAALAWLLVAGIAVADIPALPDSFVRIGRVDESGKTWRESGQMRMALSNAVETLESTFASQGYVFAHDIADSPESSRRLLYWTGAAHDILVMLWRVDNATTGVRWGLSAHGDKPADKPGGKPSSTASPKPDPSPSSPMRSVGPDGTSATNAKEKEPTP